MEQDQTNCVKATRESTCARWLYGSSGLGTEYIKCVQDPDRYLERMFGGNFHQYPKWYKDFGALDAQHFVTPIDGVLWLLSQFVVLTPITDPAVVAHRYALYQKKNIKMIPLDQIIELSTKGVGFMQCNCRNGMHYGIDPHCIGDLLHKKIIVDFTNQEDNDPTQFAARGANGRTGERVLQTGASKIRQVVAPLLQSL